jgi:hypothetical protein
MGSGVDAATPGLIAGATAAGGKAAPAGYSTWQGKILGGDVTAVPSERSASGSAFWTVTLRKGNTAVSVDVKLSGQFSAAQLASGSATKARLEAALAAQQPASGSLNAGAQGSPAALGADEVRSLKSTLQSFDGAGLSATDLKMALDGARSAQSSGRVTGANAGYLRDLIAQAERRLSTQQQGGSVLVARLGSAIRSFDGGGGREQLNTALSAVRAASKAGWSKNDVDSARAFEAQAAKRLWPPAAKATAKTPPKTVLAPNEQAMANDAKAHANNARYEMNALVRRTTGLSGIAQLPDSIAHLTNGKLNQQLNAVAREYGFGQWTELLSAAGRARIEQRGPEIAGRYMNGGVRAVTGMSPQQIGQRVVTQVNTVAKTVTGSAPIQSSQDAKPAAVKSHVNRVLTGLIERDPRFARYQGKVSSIEQLAYYRDTEPLWNELSSAARSSSSGRIVDARELLGTSGRAQLLAQQQRGQTAAPAAQASVVKRQAIGAVVTGADGRQQAVQGDLVRINGRQWGFQGSTVLHRLPMQIQDEAGAAKYIKSQISAGKWATGLRPLDPRYLGLGERGNKMTASYLKPLMHKVNAAQAETVEHEKIWADIAHSKNFGQTAIDWVRDRMGQDAEGFQLYADTRSQLDRIYQDVVARKIGLDEGNRRIDALMHKYRAENRQRIGDFGSNAEIGAAVVDAVPSVAAGFVYQHTRRITKSPELAAAAASGTSMIMRVSGDTAGPSVANFLNDHVRGGGPDRDLTRVIAQQPKITDPQRFAHNLASATGDGAMFWGIDRASNFLKPLAVGFGGTTATWLSPVVTPLFNAAKPLLSKAQPLLQPVLNLAKPYVDDIAVQLPRTLPEVLEHAFTGGTSLVAGKGAALVPTLIDTKVQGAFEQQKVQQAVDQAEASFKQQRPSQLKEAKQQITQQSNAEKSTWIHQQKLLFENSKQQALAQLRQRLDGQLQTALAQAQQAGAKPEQLQTLRAELETRRQQVLRDEAARMEAQREGVYQRINDKAYNVMEPLRRQSLSIVGRQLDARHQSQITQLLSAKQQISKDTNKAMVGQAVSFAANIPVDMLYGAPLGWLPPSARLQPGGRTFINPLIYGLESTLGLGQGLSNAYVTSLATGTPLTRESLWSSGLTSLMQFPMASNAMVRPGHDTSTTRPPVQLSRLSPGGQIEPLARAGPNDSGALWTPGQSMSVLLSAVPGDASRPPHVVLLDGGALHDSSLGRKLNHREVYGKVFPNEKPFVDDAGLPLLPQQATTGGTLRVNDDGSLTLDPTHPLNVESQYIKDFSLGDPRTRFNSESPATPLRHGVLPKEAAEKMAGLIQEATGRRVVLDPKVSAGQPPELGEPPRPRSVGAAARPEGNERLTQKQKARALEELLGQMIPEQRAAYEEAASRPQKLDFVDPRTGKAPTELDAQLSLAQGIMLVPADRQPPSATTIASHELAETFGQNINPVLRALMADVDAGRVNLGSFDPEANAQQQLIKVTQVLSAAGVNAGRTPKAATHIVTLARAINRDPVQLAQHLATRVVQRQTYVQGVNSRNPQAVDGERSPQSVEYGTEFLEALMAQAVLVPGGMAQTEIKTDLDGVLGTYAHNRGLDLTVKLPNGTASPFYLPLPSHQTLTGNPSRLRVLPNTNLAALEFGGPWNLWPQQFVVVPITPEHKAFIERGSISGIRYVEGSSAGFFPQQSMDFLKNVSTQNILTGGKLPGGLWLPRVEPNSLRPMGNFSFTAPGELGTSLARSLPLGEVIVPAPQTKVLPGFMRKPVNQPQVVSAGLPGLTIYTGGSAKTRGSTTQFFALSPERVQAIQNAVREFPGIVDTLSNKYGLPSGVRDGWKKDIWTNPDSPTMFVPDAVIKVLETRTLASHPGKLLHNLQADVERQMVDLVNRHGLSRFANLHHTPAGKTTTSDDAVAYALTPEQEANAIAEAQARGETYKRKVTTDWGLTPHSLKGMAVLDGVINKLHDLHGIDLKSELEQDGHSYDTILEMKLPEFLRFLQGPVHDKIVKHKVDLGQVIVPVDTYHETAGELSGSDSSMIKAAAALYGPQNTRVVQVDTLGGLPPTAPSHRQSFTLNGGDRGQVGVAKASVDPRGPNADLAPTMYVARQSELGQMLRDAYAAQFPLHQDEIDAVRNRPADASSPPDDDGSFVGSSGLSARDRHHEGLRREVFSEKDKEILRNAKRVFALGWSSMGAGHTKRSMDPLLDATKTLSSRRDGNVIQKGDVILMIKPPHWENDAGNEKRQLDTFRKAYEDAGARVIEVQQDRAVLGFYKDDGPSDNWRILENFPRMDGRDPLNNWTIAYGSLDGQVVEAFHATGIMKQAVAAAGDKSKFTVFTDMDPYTAKGAVRAGVPRGQIIEQSNHVGLMAPGVDFGGRSDAFLVFANGNGYPGKTALVGFDANINSLSRLTETFEALKINPETPKREMRQQVTKLVLEEGKRLPLEPDQPVGTEGGILVAPRATADNVDRMVYLYLNKYTGPLGEHIKSKLRENGDNPYKHTLFIVAGKPIAGHNAMNLAHLASADGVIAGGMGTTTEAHQLLSNGYQGKMIVMPVEHQHEQEANAHQLLPAALPSNLPVGTLTTARDNADLRRQLDDLLKNRATITNSLTGDLQNLWFMARNIRGVTAKPVALLDGADMTDAETDLHVTNAARARNPDTLAIQRMVNAVQPALDAAIKGQPTFTVKMDTLYERQTLDFDTLARALSDPGKASALLHANLSRPGAQRLRETFSDWLNQLAAADPERRRELAEGFKPLFSNETFILGY